MNKYIKKKGKIHLKLKQVYLTMNDKLDTIIIDIINKWTTNKVNNNFPDAEAKAIDEKSNLNDTAWEEWLNTT